MKKLSILFVAITSPIVVLANLGFKFQSQFIQFQPDSLADNLVVLKEGVASDVKELFVNEIERNSKIKSFKLSEDKHYVPSNLSMSKQLKNNVYLSESYLTSNNHRCYVLPKIILSLKEDYQIEDILSKFNVLSVDSKSYNIVSFKCNCSNSKEVLSIVEKIDALGICSWCEPDMLSDYTTTSFADNPLCEQQYYIENYGYTGGTYDMDINGASSWYIITGSPNITVAVIDTGVDTNHEDMSGCVLSGYTVGNTLGYGLPQCENYWDNKAHGTACAGIIAAQDNTKGIVGVAHGVKILPVNIVPYYSSSIANGFASSSQIADAIRWAYQRADVLSNSWGGGESSNAIEAAIQEARIYGRDGRGCIVVFAAGNNYQNVPDVSFPANVNGVIAVGALDKYGSICSYSQRGSSLDLVAFGGYDDIVTTDRMGNIGYTDGNYVSTFGKTSAACPQVAGVAALLLSGAPYLSENEVCSALFSTARDLGNTGQDNTYGYGLVNAVAAAASGIPEIKDYSYIYNQNIFVAYNIPNYATVSWHCSGVSSQLIEIQENTPYNNHCRIINHSNSIINNVTLTASIYINGVLATELHRTISLDPSNRMSNIVNIEQSESSIRVTINPSFEETRLERVGQEKIISDIRNWSVSVVNTLTGRQVFHNVTSDKSCIIDTDTWISGTYLLQVLVNGKQQILKIVI